jgi:hypothetical protein
MFLDRLNQLSPTEWRSIRLRSKDTKVYATAINDVEHLNSIYSLRGAAWENARSKAREIARQKAPWTKYSPTQLGDAAADAVGALVQLFPWGHSFERLYGPFSQVIPYRALGETPSRLATRSASYAPATAESAKPKPTTIATQVNYSRAIGFFGGELIVLAIWVFVSAQAAYVNGPPGLLIGGLPAVAAFFAMKVSRGPIASIAIIQDQRRLNQLKSGDKTTYDFVIRWRYRVTVVGAVLAIGELIVVLGYCLSNPVKT